MSSGPDYPQPVSLERLFDLGVALGDAENLSASPLGLALQDATSPESILYDEIQDRLAALSRPAPASGPRDEDSEWAEYQKAAYRSLRSLSFLCEQRLRDDEPESALILAEHMTQTARIDLGEKHHWHLSGLYFLGMAYLALRQFQAATVEFVKGREIAERIKSEWDLLRFTKGLAEVRLTQGEPREAIQLLESVYNKERATQSSMECRVAYLLGKSWNELGRYSDAREVLSPTYDAIWTQWKDRDRFREFRADELARISFELGLAQLNLGQLSEAEKYLLHAYKIQKKLKNRTTDLLLTLHELVRLFANTGKANKAKKALAVIRRISGSGI